MLEKLSPILPASNIDAAEAFYACLQFETIYKDEAEYLLMKREGAEVHFWQNKGLDPLTNDAGAYLRPSDIRVFDAECRALGLPETGVPRYVPMEEKPWGMAECALIDPDGNLIRAGQELPLG